MTMQIYDTYNDTTNSSNPETINFIPFQDYTMMGKSDIYIV